MFRLPTKLAALYLLAALGLNAAFTLTVYAAAVPGGVYVWQAPADAEDVTFDGDPVLRLGDTVFVGLPISMQPGAAQLEYRLHNHTQTHGFEVVAKTYTEQHLTITNQDMVDPPPETLKRIRSELARQRSLYNSFTPTVDLSSGFSLPLEGTTTSLFGHRRFFNGQPRSPHSGLDIAADAGTPILAAGDGTVTLSDDLYFNGKTLFIDHGQGLVTMYCHMSELLVAEGDVVEQGQEIGLVGSTGRSTGPHLHWSVSLNGNRVDPTTFMQLLNAETSSSRDLSGGE